MGNLQKKNITGEDPTFAVRDIAKLFTEEWQCFPTDSCLSGGVNIRLI
jgi:hypothetical protein